MTGKLWVSALYAADAYKDYGSAFIGAESATLLSPGDDQAWIIEMPEKRVIAVRGTQANWREWFSNLRASKVDTRYGKCHRGFYEAASTLSDDLDIYLSARDVEKPTEITGHSRGGASGQILGEMFAHRLNITQVTTFGSPRVWHESARPNVRHVRVASKGDPVPCVPWLGYQHKQDETVVVGRWANRFELDHSINRYIQRLESQV